MKCELRALRQTPGYFITCNGKVLTFASVTTFKLFKHLAEFARTTSPEPDDYGDVFQTILEEFDYDDLTRLAELFPEYLI